MHKYEIPKVHLLEYQEEANDTQQILKVYVPGVEKKNLKVNIENEILYVKVIPEDNQNKVVCNTRLARNSLFYPLPHNKTKSYPTLSLKDGVLTLVWNKVPSFKLENKEIKVC